MLVKKSGDTPILAGREFVNAFKDDGVRPFRQLQFSPERTGIADFVDIDIDAAFDRAQPHRLVVHVVPGRGVVQSPGLIDARAADDEPAVVEFVLFGGVQRHVGAGLVSGSPVRLRLGNSG